MPKCNVARFLCYSIRRCSGRADLGGPRTLRTANGTGLLADLHTDVRIENLIGASNERDRPWLLSDDGPSRCSARHPEHRGALPAIVVDASLTRGTRARVEAMAGDLPVFCAGFLWRHRGRRVSSRPTCLQSPTSCVIPIWSLFGARWRPTTVCGSTSRGRSAQLDSSVPITSTNSCAMRRVWSPAFASRSFTSSAAGGATTAPATWCVARRRDRPDRQSFSRARARTLRFARAAKRCSL